MLRIQTNYNKVSIKLLKQSIISLNWLILRVSAFGVNEPTQNKNQKTYFAVQLNNHLKQFSFYILSSAINCHKLNQRENNKCVK